MPKQPENMQPEGASPIEISGATGFSNIKYLSCMIDATYEKRFPEVQSVLDEAFAMVEQQHLAQSELGKAILEVLDKAQEQLSQAGEGASMINNHLGGTSRDGLLAEKHGQLMENALALLNKGIGYAVEGIKNAVTLAEQYQPETEASPEAVATVVLPEETSIAAPWLRIPHWLKQIFAYKEEEVVEPVVEAGPVAVTPQDLYKIRETLAKLYEKACIAADGKYSSIYRGDIVNALYESVQSTARPSPTSD